MATALTVFICLLGSTIASMVELSKPDLYYFLPSPPCRTVLFAAKLLNVDLNLINLNIRNKEQFTEDFLKLNPQHRVPTLNDNGFALSESRAIMGYMTSLSPSGEQFYPKDPQKRAIVDQMMYFDLDVLYSRVLKYAVVDVDVSPVVYGPSPDKAERLNAAFDMFEKYLTRTEWAAGDTMTIADVTLLTSVSMASGVGYNVSKYSKVDEWFEKTKATYPDYKAVYEDGLAMWKAVASRRKTAPKDNKANATLF